MSVGGTSVLYRSHVGTDGKHPWGCGQTEKMARKRQVSVYICFWLEESICDGRGAPGKNWDVMGASVEGKRTGCGGALRDDVLGQLSGEDKGVLGLKEATGLPHSLVFQVMGRGSWSSEPPPRDLHLLA